MNGLKHVRPQIGAKQLSELRGKSAEEIITGEDKSYPPALKQALADLDSQFPVDTPFPKKKLIIQEIDSDKVYANFGWAGSSISFSSSSDGSDSSLAATRTDSPISPSQRRLSHGSLLRKNCLFHEF